MASRPCADNGWRRTEYRLQTLKVVGAQCAWRCGSAIVGRYAAPLCLPLYCPMPLGVCLFSGSIPICQYWAVLACIPLRHLIIGLRVRVPFLTPESVRPQFSQSFLRYAIHSSPLGSVSAGQAVKKTLRLTGFAICHYRPSSARLQCDHTRERVKVA